MSTDKKPPEEQLSLFVDENGQLSFVYDDDLAAQLRDEGVVLSNDRASHVEPDPTDPSQWLVDLSPILKRPCTKGPFSSRGEALREEKQLVEKIMAGEGDEI